MHPPPPAIPPHLSARLQTARNLLSRHSGLLLCALFLLAGLATATAGPYGLSLDELTQRQIAQANLDYLLNQAGYPGPPVNPAIDTAQLIPSDRYYGIAFELPLLLAERLLGPSADYHHIHRLRLILTHLFFIAGGYFCYRLAYRLFNSRLIAILALLFYLLHPRLYAHSLVNSKDLPFLALFILTLYLLERAFRRDTPAAFLLLGIAVGLLTNLRIMGLMLLAAVIAMRALDFLYAGPGAARKQILQTSGLFILAAALTWYAATPYAWNNPLDYLAASLDLTLRHPHTAWQLFQGQLIPANALPPHYTLTWFSITTPPLILLLGLVGITAVALCGIRQPAALFRNTRLRFALLLLAAFILPPLAAALLGSVQYGGWRHFFFGYAPFGLLAAIGSGWLLAALARRPPCRPAAIALAAAGLSLILLQMTQIHPLQYGYFNFLVNRAAPEHLRTRYEMDYWRFSYQAALERLLTLHPHAALTVRGGGKELVARYRKILPPAARQRLQTAAANHRADYELIHNIDPSQPDLAFNSAYRRRLYNNTLITARPLNAALMSAAAIAAYQEIYRQTLTRKPILRAAYKVYLNDKRLTFVRENCPPESPDAWLGVKLFPHHPETLPAPWRDNPGSYAAYGTSAVRLDNLCLAILHLPDYAQGDLIIMQRNLGPWGPVAAPLWQELHSLSHPALNDLLAQGRQNRPHPLATPVPPTLNPGAGQPPATPIPPIPNPGAGQAAATPVPPIPNPGAGQPPAAPIPFILNSVEGQPPAFEVFLDHANGRHRLLYAKKNCSPADYQTPVFLHIAPLHLADLPPSRQASGFANHDFPLNLYGGRPGGHCIALVPLPNYPIKSLRTGQFLPNQGELWSAELALEP